MSPTLLLLLRLRVRKPQLASLPIFPSKSLKKHVTSYHKVHNTTPTSSPVSEPKDVSPNRQVAKANWTITQLSREGKISDARRVFDHMVDRDVVSWTSVISAYIRCGMMRDARLLFNDPRAVKNVVTWTAMLSGYVRLKMIKEAKELFWVMPEKNVVSWNTMIRGYADSGMVEEALSLFDIMPVKNVVSWNTIVSALARSGRIDEALDLFEQMKERDVISWTTVVTGLSQNGRIDEARAYFDKMPERNVISWNAMISGYAQNGKVDEAFILFEEMPQKDLASWNGMITGFIQNGELSRARSLFDRVEARNVVTWTTLITGYVQDGQGEEAISIFTLMQNEGIKPNQGTFVSVLAAISDLAGLGEGKQVHQIICKTFFQLSPFVQSALISMYAKCGDIVMAREMFDEAEHRDLVTWNSMVAAYAHHGSGSEVINIFEDMRRNGIKPDGASYIGVLTGCSHSGLVNEGLALFDMLLNDDSIEVREDHYACLVDLCGRAGQLEEAAKIIDRHEVSRTSACVWGSLLAGCNFHGNISIGNLAAERLMKAEPGNAGTYMLLSNIYASEGRWGEAAKVRFRMKGSGLKKQPGCSWIEVENMVHVFVARDKSHKQREKIKRLIQDLHCEMKMAWYVPDSKVSLDGDLYFYMVS